MLDTGDPDVADREPVGHGGTVKLAARSVVVLRRL